MTAEDKQYLSELDRWCPRHPPAALDAGATGPDLPPGPVTHLSNNDSRQIPTGGRPDHKDTTLMDLTNLSEEQLLDLLEAVLAEKSRRRVRRVQLEGLR